MSDSPSVPARTTSWWARRRVEIIVAAVLMLGLLAVGLVAASGSLDAAEPDPSEPVAIDAEAAIAAPATWEPEQEWFTTGFLDFSSKWVEDDLILDKTAGFSMYVAAWPFQRTYPGPAYQTGLPSAWLHPAEPDGGDHDNFGDDLYSTIEGGLGWWNDTRFATETPKFIMGGVARDFVEWANGPGAGSGGDDVDGRRGWDVPLGKYGVAQLSPNVLWAPDGLNLEEGTNGELFGYGYHPLPIVDTQTETAGSDITTGNNSWTLFLSTGNFQGPVSFFIPNFFSKPALDDPAVEGLFFDSAAAEPRRGIAMETQVIPSAYGTDVDGASYARITETQFPASGPDSSILLNRVASYSHDALSSGVAEWFDGGEPPTDLFDVAETHFNEFDEIDAAEASSYMIIYEGIEEAEEYPIDWSLLAEVDVSDPLTFQYRWNLDLVERDGDSFRLPEYYRLVEGSDGPTWRPILDSEVPADTGLLEHDFAELGQRNDTEPFETPDDPDSIWQTPGPVAGPFEAELGDGSVVTYSWYRFIDQPAIVHWDFSDEERTTMQARVEDLHREWGSDKTYLAPPSVGELANLDPAIVVEPPEGMEIGFVPIVTRQELAAD